MQRRFLIAIVQLVSGAPHRIQKEKNPSSTVTDSQSFVHRSPANTDSSEMQYEAKGSNHDEDGGQYEMQHGETAATEGSSVMRRYFSSIRCVNGSGVSGDLVSSGSILGEGKIFFIDSFGTNCPQMRLHKMIRFSIMAFDLRRFACIFLLEPIGTMY